MDRIKVSQNLLGKQDVAGIMTVKILVFTSHQQNSCFSGYFSALYTLGVGTIARLN